MPLAPIEINNLVFKYESKQRKQKPVLEIENWVVNKNERVFLYGDSGSGKTTLLNLLCGLYKSTTGTIKLQGQDLGSLSGAKRDAFRAKNIGVVFQSFNLVPYLSVFKNIQLASFFANQLNADLKKRAQSLAASLRLPEDIMERRVAELSVGQQQRVAIVRAMINKPNILLVDEPTSALDASARDAFMNELTSLSNQASTAMVFVSHDKTLEKYFDTSVNLNTLNKAKFTLNGNEEVIL